MTQEQWQKLLEVIDGRIFDPLCVGFIIDSAWLPSWAGMSIMDYYSSEKMWLDANLKALRQFDDIIFLPGFWSEFGMCTEPTSFGTKCIWDENGFPFAKNSIANISQIDNLRKPAVGTDGLCPFVLKRLEHCRGEIERAGHSIKFAVSRGPLTIASFVMGATEFLTTIKINPGHVNKLLAVITDFIVDWLGLQIERFNSIDGILILDDIVGFIGDDDFRKIALGALKRIYGSFEVSVKFFHNDASGLVCAPYLSEIGVNLFNFSFEHSLNEMRKLTGNDVVLLGNIAPRDVLAEGTKAQVTASTKELLNSIEDKSRIIISCGGGMPSGVSTENIEALMSVMGY